MRNLDVKNTEAADVFKEVFRQIGWGDEEIRLIEQATIPFEPYVSVAVAFQVPMNLNDVRTNKPFMTYFKSLLEKTRNSQLVKEETRKLQKELDHVNGLLKARDAELGDLRQYKAHYDVEMKLRHGEQDDE